MVFAFVDVVLVLVYLFYGNICGVDVFGVYQGMGRFRLQVFYFRSMGAWCRVYALNA